MKSLLSLIVLLTSFSASAYFTDEYYFYRFVHPVKRSKVKTVVVKDKKKPKNDTEKTERVEVKTNAKPTQESASKICKDLGFLAASSFTAEVAMDGKLTSLIAVDCR